MEPKKFLEINGSVEEANMMRRGRPHRRVIVWFRRDLRIEDNPALLAAATLADEVLPVYIYVPEEEGQFQPGRCSRWWLTCSLRSLDTQLQDMGTKLLCFRGTESLKVLEHLVDTLNVDAVFFNHLYDPISMVRDNEVKQGLLDKRLVCRSFNGDMLREPWEVVQEEDKSPFSSFESFWSAHQAIKQDPPPPAPAPEILPGINVSVNHLEVDQIGIMSQEEESSNSQLEIHWEPGHKGAMKHLDNFISLKLKKFSQDKAKTDRKSTSHLSPYLHFGEVGVRTVRKAILDATRFWDKESCQSHVADFFRQIGFREYSRYLSFHFPFTHERSMLGYLRAVPWRYDQSLFKAWRTGNTGYPLVDAGMREIWSTGWMHNRCRVVCASFLVKHLLLPWQWGLKHYWDALLDADLECDALGWQYCAGCLSDGHVFSEVMDLDREAKRYDPKGAYVRRWLPVLARIPTEYIHAPWKAPRQVLDDAGVELGVDYPFPVVQPEEARITLSKAAEVISKAEQSSDINSYASGPYRPPTKALPETSSLTWDVAGQHYEASSIASFHSGLPRSGFVQPSGAASRSLLQECMSTHDPKMTATTDCTDQHPAASNKAACSFVHEAPTAVSDWPPDKRAKLSLHTNEASKK